MYLGMAAGPRAAAAHIDQPMATCLLAARTLPLLPLVTSHRAPSTEHWALSTLGTGRWARCLLCRQRLAPFIPISAPTLPSLGFPPPSRRGKHGQCALQFPSAHFDAPEHATRLHENLAGLFHLTHASAATDQGAGRHILLPVCQSPSPAPVRSDAALQSHQDTPELDASFSVWNSTPDTQAPRFLCDQRAARPPARQKTQSSSFACRHRVLIRAPFPLIANVSCLDLTGLCALNTTAAVCRLSR